MKLGEEGGSDRLVELSGNVWSAGDEIGVVLKRERMMPEEEGEEEEAQATIQF